ncbi:ankyrin repeat domain-containing protein [Desulfosarcina sp. OttesenSCG-928-B08]|nr:ankyrin repeat domain-containing protein [Desulfosarcina sp. OttesenSCG-928-B08]
MMSCTFLKFIICILLVLLALFLAGCGVVVDGVNRVRAFQFDPGKLYSSEFYRTATPEEVKAAIGGRSLAGKSFTVKEYRRDTGGFLGDLKKVLGVVLPLSEIREYTLYPLTIAVQISPYPEVIALLLEAGAELGPHGQRAYFSYNRPSQEIDKVMLRSGDHAFVQRGLVAYARQNNREMVDFCLALPETTSDASHAAAWTEADLLPALKVGLTLKHAEMAAYLLERGAAIPKNPADQNALFSAALRSGNTDGFRLLLEQGADCSAQGRTNLLADANAGNIRDESILKQLAGSVSLEGQDGYEALRALCSIGNAEALDIALRRTGGLQADAGQQLKLLETALYTQDLAFFRHLVEQGADCGAVDKRGENELMQTAWYRAGENAELMEYLSARVPVDGDNGREALRYACRAGNLKAVRKLLDRGVTPKAGYRFKVGGGAAEAAVISALLRERGYLPE